MKRFSNKVVIITGAAGDIGRAAASRFARGVEVMATSEYATGEGVVRDQSELARLANVSQPRMTQIMRLLSLAPEIQEDLLFLPRVVRGKPLIHEKMLRPIAAEMDWRRQRRMWEGVERM